MGNSTKDSSIGVLHIRLTTVLDAYRGLLRADERRLQDAMRDFERSCWAERARNAA